MTDPHNKSDKNFITHRMGIDIYATKSTGEITVLHEEPFSKPIKHLEYNSTNQTLLFVFDDFSQIPYNEKIRDVIAGYISQADEAAFFQMDKKKKQPVNGFTVPIKVVDY